MSAFFRPKKKPSPTPTPTPPRPHPPSRNSVGGMEEDGVSFLGVILITRTGFGVEISR